MEPNIDSFRATPELPHRLNRLSETVIGSAIEVHRALGPGLLERLYEEALIHELSLRRLAIQCQAPITFSYKGKALVGQRMDVLVEGELVLELKAVEAVNDVHLAQLLGYLRAGPYPIGLLINFNVPVLKNGIFRRVNSAALGHGATPGPLSAASASPPRPLRTSSP